MPEIVLASAPVLHPCPGRYKIGRLRHPALVASHKSHRPAGPSFLQIRNSLNVLRSLKPGNSKYLPALAPVLHYVLPALLCQAGLSLPALCPVRSNPAGLVAQADTVVVATVAAATVPVVVAMQAVPRCAPESIPHLPLPFGLKLLCCRRPNPVVVTP